MKSRKRAAESWHKRRATSDEVSRCRPLSARLLKLKKSNIGLLPVVSPSSLTLPQNRLTPCRTGACSASYELLDVSYTLTCAPFLYLDRTSHTFISKETTKNNENPSALCTVFSRLVPRPFDCFKSENGLGVMTLPSFHSFFCTCKWRPDFRFPEESCKAYHNILVRCPPEQMRELLLRLWNGLEMER